MKERATFVEDILIEGDYLLNKPTTFDEQTVSKKWNSDSPILMNEWMKILSDIENFSSEKIEIKFKEFINSKNLGIGAVLPLYRLLITGQGMGPSMFEISSFLGKEECINRINEGIAKLS